VYGAVYAPKVRRTNVYLSEDEQMALDALAVAEGSTRSDVLRSIIDREMNLAGDADPALDAAVADAAGEIAAQARALSESDPDLSIG
jgi:hypothetical protein